MRYKVVHIEEKITLSGFVILPESWEDKLDESELGAEFLDVDNDSDDDESEVDEEYIVELSDQDAKENLYKTVDWDFVKKNRIEE